MSRRIYSGSSQYLAPGAARTLHTGAGKLHALIATSGDTTAGQLSLYDGPSAAGAPLLVVDVSASTPVMVFFPPAAPPVFTLGLTAVTSAGVHAFLITEGSDV